MRSWSCHCCMLATHSTTPQLHPKSPKWSKWPRFRSTPSFWGDFFVLQLWELNDGNYCAQIVASTIGTRWVTLFERVSVRKGSKCWCHFWDIGIQSSLRVHDTAQLSCCHDVVKIHVWCEPLDGCPPNMPWTRNSRCYDPEIGSPNNRTPLLVSLPYYSNTIPIIGGPWKFHFQDAPEKKKHLPSPARSACGISRPYKRWSTFHAKRRVHSILDRMETWRRIQWPGLDWFAT